MAREMDTTERTSNDSGVLSDSHFKAYQELIRESMQSDPNGGIYVVDELSHGVHEGRAFVVSQDGSLLSGASLYMLGKVGAKEAHFHGFNISASDGDISVHLYENPTVTADGTPAVAVNKNRRSTNVATLEVFGGATVSSDGTVLEHDHTYGTGGVGSNTSGGTGALDEDWVLAPNTNYLVKIDNHGASTVEFTAKFTWSENDPV